MFYLIPKTQWTSPTALCHKMQILFLKVYQVMNGFKWAKDIVFQLDTQKISAKTTFSL